LAISAGKSGFDALKKTFTKKDKDGFEVIDWPALATAGVGLYGLMGDKDSGGYSKPVPKMYMVREQVLYNDPARPGFFAVARPL
jgi:hypothetical protein